jgi:hypothetical protein
LYKENGRTLPQSLWTIYLLMVYLNNAEYIVFIGLIEHSSNNSYKSQSTKLNTDLNVFLISLFLIPL